MNMNPYAETFNKMISQAGGFGAPLVKVNQMAVDNFEKIVDFQLKSLQKYADIGIDNMKAAARISSPGDWQSFLSKQTDTFNAVRTELMEDVKTLTALGSEMREDAAKLTEQGIQELKSATEETADTIKTRKTARKSK